MVQEKVKIEKKEIQAQFLAEVEFGVASEDCRNFGICRVTSIGKRKLDNCKQCRCEAIITVFSEDYVEISFLKKTVSALQYKKHFSRKIFLVQETYEEIGISGDLFFKIQKGKYSIQEDACFLRIVFVKCLNITI